LCFISGSASSVAGAALGGWEPVSQSDTTFQQAGIPFRSLPQILSKEKIWYKQTTLPYAQVQVELLDPKKL
jgi:hypothetical protein